jgi:hypothetical protein
MHYYTAVDVGMESVKKELFKVLPNTCNIDDLLVQMVSAEPLTCDSPLVIPTSNIGQTIKVTNDFRFKCCNVLFQNQDSIVSCILDTLLKVIYC